MSPEQGSFSSGEQQVQKDPAPSPASFISTNNNSATLPPLSMPKPRRNIPVKWIILVVVVAAVLALLYYFRSVFVAATINGKVISRYSIVKELEKQMGAQVMDSLVVQALIEQKADEAGMVVAVEDIEKEIKIIEENLSQQGTTLDDALKAQGVTRAAVERDIRFRKLAEKIVADKVQVTEDEIAKYIEENKQFLPPAESDEKMKEQVTSMLSQQKFSAAFQEWLTAAKAEADISYWKEY
ncbi:MAG: hypothetical protein AAB710_00555 [Patescibacteria group bacterium]